MNVEVFNYTPLLVAVRAIRKCYNSQNKSDSGSGSFQDNYKFILGKNDKELIKRIIETGHLSTLEHVYYNIEIDGISRALLQELSRHRIASLSVESSRYTLKKMLTSEIPVEDMFVQTGDPGIDNLNFSTLHTLKQLILSEGLPNDIAKYSLPEAYKTELILTINVRSLRNLLELRTSPRALKEFQKLSRAIFEALPEDHKFMFEDIVTKL